MADFDDDYGDPKNLNISFELCDNNNNIQLLLD